MVKNIDSVLSVQEEIFCETSANPDDSSANFSWAWSWGRIYTVGLPESEFEIEEAPRRYLFGSNSKTPRLLEGHYFRTNLNTHGRTDVCSYKVPMGLVRNDGQRSAQLDYLNMINNC